VTGKKPAGIPLSALIKSDGFKRNYDIEFKTALDAEVAAAAARGAKAQTNLDRKGKKLQRTQHITALATQPENLRRSARWLFDHLTDADKAIVGDMKFPSFRKHVPARK
jgi:hypothetical protein